MRTHEIIVGWLHIAAGAFVFGIVAILLYLAAQLAYFVSGTFIPHVFVIFALPIAVILLATSGVEIAAGVALIGRNAAPHGWACPVLIGVSALQLLIFPIGTAIAIYTIWALLFLKPDVPALPTSTR